MMKHARSEDMENERGEKKKVRSLNSKS